MHKYCLKTNNKAKQSQSVAEYYAICTLCKVGNPTGSGSLEMCNYCEQDNRLWEKAKDKMHKAAEKTLCC